MNNESVDFDFFDTPRNDTERTSPKRSGFVSKPPTSESSGHTSKQGELTNGKGKQDTRFLDASGKRQSSKKTKYSSDSDSSAADSDSSYTPRGKKQSSQKTPAKPSSQKAKEPKDDYSFSESSSAYSYSDYSSDEETDKGNDVRHKKEVVAVRVPSAQDAWADDDNSPRESSKKSRRPRSYSSGSESDIEEYKNKSSEKPKRNERIKSAKSRDRRNSDERKRRPIRSNSGSFSNNSDITDVSPLDSPENSPRGSRKRNSKAEKENGKYADDHGVQYRGQSPTSSANIKLETEDIDLSILMKCMSDIDREKQQRLKTNTRRVMFAPPAMTDKGKANYTFSMDQAKTIEKENQRLLKQIMNQVHGGSKRYVDVEPKGPRRPKKATEPVVQRLTPSAVNRMRDQRRIEAENMHILKRLHTVKASKGISRHEQLDEFERQMSYGIPTGTIIVPGEVVPPNRPGSRVYSAASTQRGSRPSSAKSNSSLTPGKRSRPSSAKSNASVMSNASMRSNASKRSTTSIRSTASIRSNMSFGSMRHRADSKIDNRPAWDDRFSFS